MIEQQIDTLTAKLARNNELIERMNNLLEALINNTPTLSVVVSEPDECKDSPVEIEKDSGLNEAQILEKIPDEKPAEKVPTEEDEAEALNARTAICNKLFSLLKDQVKVKKIISDFGFSAGVKAIPFERTEEFLNYMNGFIDQAQETEE